ncbi:MAG: 4-hydroxythreonine-4-phosphate dehydrogenase PdxA [Deltaproteobacteria bacterium]|nr:4-hydroxythreonine-4-phosphate dehydrogenase PdxA [Deltaproteobacteria bacterium]MBW2132824.1 4-hydroxythreonine-4-phosphate dehydrogenase PdxA [Deltaproteobacteria bacterium]
MKGKRDMRPTIAVTMGDPVGIGPEIIVKAMAQNRLSRFCTPLVVGDPFRLDAAAKCVGFSPNIRVVSRPGEAPDEKTGITVIPVSRLHSKKFTWGKPTRSTAAAAVRYITTAVDLAQRGDAAAMVTCPVHKSAFRLTGLPFAGHTELIADRTGSSNFVMMMAGNRLKVALATIHVPLGEVLSLLTPERVFRTIRITAEGLMERFGIASPCIGVAGLNPHAGENGRFGNEERQILIPAVRRARRAGYRVEGPYPPDTVFYRALKGAFHAVIAMYHDQGLIPFKLIHFTDGVNTTLGLPLIRTSVDHGTAYDIAGTGTADPGSLVAAVRMAADQANHRHRSLRKKSTPLH